MAKIGHAHATPSTRDIQPMRTALFTASVLALGMAACSPPEEAAPAPAEPLATATPPAGVDAMTPAPVGTSARAALAGSAGAPAGSVTFRQGPQGLVLRVEASGLTPGWHGVHLHATGTCEGPKFTTAGAHVHGGTGTAVHGLLNAGATDSGDLPNVHADAEGRVDAEIFTPFARLADTGPGQPLLDVDGSAILIHASPDDYSSQPIGGSGDRVACGVITAG